MSINAFPINTVPPTADLIINAPSGPITAINVQAALNQLAGLIPSPGPGTDPLFLTQGFSLNTTNPTWFGNPNEIVAAKYQMSTDGSVNNPNFSDANLSEWSLFVTNGQATYGGGTNCKLTFLNQSVFQQNQGSGQKFLQDLQMIGYGMSDTGIASWRCQYAGGPINGDEGQCFMPVSTLQQQGGLTLCTIASTTQSAIAAGVTTTQTITASKDPQTVTVSATTGLVANDWVVIEQQLPTPSLNMEAVQVTSFGPTTITGIFRCNHSSGVTVTPALRLTVSGLTNLIGQDRYIVNLTKPSYATGTVSAITGACVCTGVGTTWAVNMVGGNAKNIGCIALNADDYTGSPFDAGTNRLRSWNAINQFTSTTSLGFISFSVAGDGSYKGKGPGAGGYIIRQSAKVLKILFSGELICETSTSTWNVGDNLEQAICPYPDVSGQQLHYAQWTNGGTLRGAMIFTNLGARMFNTCLSFNEQGRQSFGSDIDPYSWNTVLSLQCVCGTGLEIDFSQVCAIRLHLGASAGQTDAGSAILWGTGNYPTSAGIWRDSTNNGMIFAGIGGGDEGKLEWVSAGAKYTDPFGRTDLQLYDSNLHFRPTVHFAASLMMDRTTDLVNYDRFQIIWDVVGNPFVRLGTVRGGTSTDNVDLVMTTQGVDWLTFQDSASGNIKFTSSRNFTANGTTATAITSVGPAGASTTVQKWLTIRDDTNALRYIPCF